MENKTLHGLLSRMDTKASLFIMVISAVMATAKLFIDVSWVIILFYSLMAATLLCMLLIIAPWFVGKGNQVEGNIWNYWSDKNTAASEEELTKSLANLIKLKWVLFWVAVAFIILATILTITLEAIYA